MARGRNQHRRREAPTLAFPGCQRRSTITARLRFEDEFDARIRIVSIATRACAMSARSRRATRRLRPARSRSCVRE